MRPPWSESGTSRRSLNHHRPDALVSATVPAASPLAARLLRTTCSLPASPRLSLLRLHVPARWSRVHRACPCHVTQSACTAAPCRDAVKGLADMAALQRLTVPCYACSHRWAGVAASMPAAGFEMDGSRCLAMRRVASDDWWRVHAAWQWRSIGMAGGGCCATLACWGAGSTSIQRCANG